MSATTSQTTVPMAQNSIPMNYKTSQRAKKAAKKEQKASSTVFVEDQPKASHIIGSKADFNAMTAERPAPPPHAMKTPFLSIDELADPGVIIPDVVQEEVVPKVTVKAAPPPKPLTKSFAGAVGPSSSLRVAMMPPKQAATPSMVVPGPKRVVSGYSSSSRHSSPLSSVFSATTSQSTLSFATMVKGNPYTALNSTMGSPEQIHPLRKEKDFPRLGSSRLLPEKQLPRAVAAGISAAERDVAGFTTVTKNSVKIPFLEPVPSAKKANAKTVTQRPVAPPSDTKFTFVRPNSYKRPFHQQNSTASTDELDVARDGVQPDLEQVINAVEQSGGWTTASSKKQPKFTKPLAAMAPASASAPTPKPVAKLSRTTKVKKPLGPAPTPCEVKLKDELEASTPTTSAEWTNVVSKKPKTTSFMAPKVTATKQPVNAFEKLNRTSKLASSSVAETKNPQQLLTPTVTSASIIPITSATQPIIAATEAQTSNRKKLTRSQRAKLSKEKARKQAAKPAATTNSVASAEAASTATQTESAADSSTDIEKAIAAVDGNVETHAGTTFVPSTTASLDGNSDLCSTEEADSSMLTDETEDTVDSTVLSTTGEPCEDAHTAVDASELLAEKIGLFDSRHQDGEMTPSRFCLQHGFDDMEFEEELKIAQSNDIADLVVSDDAETTFAALEDVEMTQSRFSLQHGFEDLEDNEPKTDQPSDIADFAIVDGDGTTTVTPLDIRSNDSRFCLQHGFDVLDDMDELQVEMIFDISKPDAVAFNVMESRFHLQHGCDDDGEENEEISMDDEPVLEVGLFQLCHIALIEVAMHHEASDKISAHAMQALQQVKLYGRELPTFEPTKTKDIVNEHKANTCMAAPTCTTNGIDSNNFSENNVVLELKQDTGHAATNTDLLDGQQQDPAPEPEIVIDGTISPRMTIDDATTHQTYMGLIPVADFLERLTHEDATDGTYTKRQVVRAYAAMSNRERELCGMDPVNISTKEILRSTSLQYTTRIGRTKMIDLLARVGFNNDVATTEIVAEACMKAAQEELAFRMSPAGRKVARAIAIYASRT